MRRWFRRSPSASSAQKSLYIERPCIGCLEPFKRWGVERILLSEQFCSKRCKKAFHRGYRVGMNLRTDLFNRHRRRTKGTATDGEWWR